MTINEFNEYVASFNKQPGEYSIEEQVQIGLKLKELPVYDRNWDNLVEILGSELSGDALRSRVYRFAKKIEELVEANEGDAYKENYIEKQKVRDWYNAYRRDIRQEVRIENLKDEIKAAADRFGKLPAIRFKEVREPRDTEAVLCVSDLHIGAECDNYYNKYNVEIAKQRLASLVAKTKIYCALHHVKTLHILNLGDAIAGLIHTNARIEQQMDVAEQIMLAGEYLAEAVNELQSAAPIVTYRSVFDNHSRAVANKAEHIEKEQFSRVIDWFIEERLKASSVKFMNDNIDGGVIKFTLQNGKKIVAAHGHQDSLNNSWQNFVGMTKEWIDYIVLAHYHAAKEKSYNGATVFVNGSIVGTESYAFGRRLFGKPTQKLLVFNSDDDVVDINIGL